MPYNPFGDYAKRGYLRNVLAAKRAARVKAYEHASFLLHVEDAVALLAHAGPPITYEDVLKVHRTLFIDFYPWAGQDRFQLRVSPHPHRGSIHFEQSVEIRRAMQTALNMGNEADQMKAQPGAVLSLMAWAHPFLDGNGRTILLTHGELCRRAGISIAWELSDKSAYLDALGRDLEDPSSGCLDAYLRPLIGPARQATQLIRTYRSMPGLKGYDDPVQRRPKTTGRFAPNTETGAETKELPRRRRP